MPEPLRAAAILFDLDGTLLLSQPAVERCWRAFAEAHDLDADEVLEVCHGRRPIETIRKVASDLDAEEAAEEQARREADDLDGVEEIAGAKALLGRLPQGRWAIVTSGPRIVAEARMRRLGLPIPDAMVTAEDVDEGKPSPQPYVRGAEALGIAADRCIVIEDAAVGVESAHAAGCLAVAVCTTHERDELAAADLVVDDLADLDVQVDDDGVSISRR